MAKPQDAVLTIDELAKYLKLSKSKLYHLTRRDDVPGQKVGRHWRFHRAIVDHWLGNSQADDQRATRNERSHQRT